MSEDLAQQVADGQRAELLLNDPLVKGAFEALERDYNAAWTQTGAKDTDARERLWQAYQIVGKVRTHMLRVMSDGQLAKAEIQEIEAMGERKKKFGVF
jgi:hypothetical protein